MPIATLVSILLAFNAPPSSPSAAPPASPAATPAATPPAASPLLSVGAVPPELSVDTWVKGDEVKAFDPEKVYVVEFWATWCGPCLASIPHLTKIQTENPTDLVVIGVAASEKPATKKETGADENSTDPADPKAMSEKLLAKVQTFVNQQGAKMNYRIAFDADGSMGRDWMRAAKQSSIPCAFIVGKGGKIAWIGNPKDMESPLAKALGKEPPAKKKKTTAKPGGAKGGTGESSGNPADKKALE